MVYKRVFCRTKIINEVNSFKANDDIVPISSLLFKRLSKNLEKTENIKCQRYCAYPIACHNVDLKYPSKYVRLSSSSLRRLLIFALFIIYHLVSVCAIPTSISYQLQQQQQQNYRQTSNHTSTVNNVIQSSKQNDLYPKQNRSFRQTQNLEENVNSRLIVGFKLEGDEKSIISSDEQYTVKANAHVTILMFGTDFSTLTHFTIAFSNEEPDGENSLCHVRAQTVAKATVVSKHMAQATISLAKEPDGLPYYLCYSLPNSNVRNMVFQYASQPGEPWFQIIAEAPFVPVWVQIILIILLLTMSGLFSGLNLGLMALDKNELQVIERCGTEQEKFWSRTIAPVRKRGNYLLCTLLLGNVLVNSTLTIFMDDLTSGIFAVISSTLAIVIFGEIIPQALCSRHGLAVGAKTIYITYLFMGITFPLSYPISLILDKILGEEIGNVYDRERLMEYIRVTKDYNRLEADEMNIISGALKFKNIRVVDVMTPMDDVFMLPYDTALSFDTLTLINNSGYSRIPVFENERDNVVGILHVKDLSLIDTDHNLPLKVVLDFYSHPLFSVFEDVTLDVMLDEFKKGKSHMALVRRVIDNGITDPFYELLGVVTLEDIIEELIQAEINDETDVISDNRRKQKRKEVAGRSNKLDFIQKGFKNMPGVRQLESKERIHISPQLALAAFRFLASSVEPFRQDYLTEEVLKLLMSQNVYFEAKGEARKSNINDMSKDNVLYVRDKPADYFIMILEGRARVIATREGQEYDAGTFCCFGINALINSTNAPCVSFDNSKSESKASSTDEKSKQNSPKASLSPVNLVDTCNNNLTTNQAKPLTVPYVPDFTLFCMERTVYMKITHTLYTTAITTTELEKERIRLNKSESVNTFGNESSDVTSDLKELIPKDRKKSQFTIDKQKLRKISMSTNLPESSLSHLETFTKDIVDDKLGENVSKINIPESLPLSRPVSNESILKRSDAVDLLSDDTLDVSNSDQIRMKSLSNDNKIEQINSNRKPNNGSLSQKATNSDTEGKLADIDDQDETIKLI